MEMLVFEKNGKVLVSSRQIAEHFEKEHKHVLESIRNLELDDEFRRSNFRPSSYLNSQNKEMPEIVLTRDGFTLLAMGFTGEKAFQWKVKYIQAFNKMEEVIHKKKSPLDLMFEQLQYLKEIEQKQIEQSSKLLVIEEKLKKQDSSSDYVTCIGYARTKNIKINFGEALRLGKLAASECRENGIPIYKVKDERYGQVNTYPIEILDIVFGNCEV